MMQRIARMVVFVGLLVAVLVGCGRLGPGEWSPYPPSPEGIPSMSPAASPDTDS